MCVLSHDRLFVTPWAVTPQAPLSLGLPHQEYWSGLPFPSPGDLPNLGTEPVSPAAPALAGGSLPLSHPGSPQVSQGTFDCHSWGGGDRSTAGSL